MAFGPISYDAASPCRLLLSISGDDAAADLVVSNADLVAACVDGPLKTFLQTALTNPAQQDENLRITLTPAGISPPTGAPDTNSPNWGVVSDVDGSFKTTLVVSQGIAAATVGSVFVGRINLEYIHSIVR